MTNDQHAQDRTEPLTEQEKSLMATLAGRVAGYRVQLDLIVLRSLTRELEQQQA